MLATQTTRPPDADVRSAAPALRTALDRLDRAASHTVAVMLTGPRGTPKLALAQHLHGAGPRAARPLVALSCAAFPAPEIEAALFGRGVARGRFEQADGGTLFLDDIDALPRDAQSRLAMFLTDKTLRKASGPHRLDVRLVAGTALDLPTLAQQGRFSTDLLLRLSLVVEVPSLAERSVDVPMLARGVLERARRQDGRAVHAVSAAALEALMTYAWPGNDKELELVVARAALVCEDGVLDTMHLPAEIARSTAAVIDDRHGFALQPDAQVLSFEAYEEKALLMALAQTGGNVTAAAKVLGIGRATFYRKVKKFGLDVGRDGPGPQGADGE